uniref:Histidine phosphatase superfamily n=1 Tax=Strongyloides venezuelensis TaxID=75913 RepID=A0A0K0G2U0_STRVS
MLSLNFIVNETYGFSRRNIVKRKENINGEPNITQFLNDHDETITSISSNLIDNESIIEAETMEHDIDTSTVMIIYALRHGNRNPSKYFESNPLKRGWGEEGPLELNRRGKNEVFNFGVRLRHFLNGFIRRNFNGSEVNLYTSSANRCQMTLQLVSAAVFRPIGYGSWRDNLDWSPTPYNIVDDLLRPYAKKCDAVKAAWEPIEKEVIPEIQEQVKSNQDIINFFEREGGIFKFDSTRPYNELANIADNFHNYQIYRKPFPDFVTNVNFSNYNQTNLVEKVLTFIEGPQIACANDKKCGYFMGGNWLSHIKNELLKKANKTNNYPVKMIGYSSHTEILLSTMKLMGIDQNEVRTGCGFIIQLREKPFWSLKILKHNTIYQNNKLTGHSVTIANYSKSLKKISMNNGWIDLKNFTNFIQNNTLDDWEEICPTCTNKMTDIMPPKISDNKISGDSSNPKYDRLNATDNNSSVKIYSPYNVFLLISFTIISVICKIL